MLLLELFLLAPTSVAAADIGPSAIPEAASPTTDPAVDAEGAPNDDGLEDARPDSPLYPADPDDEEQSPVVPDDDSESDLAQRREAPSIRALAAPPPCGDPACADQILPIAENRVSATCDVDLRALQTVLIVTKKYGQVTLSDLNRRCLGHQDVSCGSSPEHCVKPSTGIDFNGYSGRLISASSQTVPLLQFIAQFASR